MAKAANNLVQSEFSTIEGQHFGFTTSEYREVCQNIRESWSYTTTLLRHYLIIQIALLSLVGLGNSAITSTTTTIFTGTVSPSKAPSQPLPNQSTANPPEMNISVQEVEALNREARVKRLARYGTIGALIFIGAGFSLGAWRQSRRIFYNSTNFVKRAAAIERRYGVGDLAVNGQDVPPLHVYMLGRLNDQQLYKMEKALSITYGLGGVLWLFMGALLLWPLVSSWLLGNMP